MLSEFCTTVAAKWIDHGIRGYLSPGESNAKQEVALEACFINESPWLWPWGQAGARVWVAVHMLHCPHWLEAVDQCHSCSLSPQSGGLWLQLCAAVYGNSFTKPTAITTLHGNGNFHCQKSGIVDKKETWCWLDAPILPSGIQAKVAAPPMCSQQTIWYMLATHISQSTLTKGGSINLCAFQNSNNVQI